MEFYLQQQSISIQDDDIIDDNINDYNKFPIHVNVDVSNKKIESVCFTNSMVMLSDNY